MPGMILSASCPCGFRRRNLRIGVDDAMSRSVILACYRCGRMFSMQIDAERSGKTPQCRDCWEELADLADPANWVPAELGRKYPEADPWLLAEDFGRMAPEDMELAGQIRFRCPKCGEFRMTVATGGFWD